MVSSSAVRTVQGIARERGRAPDHAGEEYGGFPEGVTYELSPKVDDWD